MNFTGPSVSAGGTTARRAFEFGRTYVVRPKGKHQATIVWLHGLGDKGSRSGVMVEDMLIRTVGDSSSAKCKETLLPCENGMDIKWICPSAPLRPISLFGGFPSTAWFDVNELSENAKDDVEGLDDAAAYIASLLATEPPEMWDNCFFKLGVGGFSMGAATSLYSATCFGKGNYGNGTSYPVKLSAVGGLCGWLPCAMNLGSKIQGDEAGRRAASLPILLCHGRGDERLSLVDLARSLLRS